MTSFDGPVWRLLPRDLVATPAAPARARCGRFHHSGQLSAYASLSAEGAGVPVRRYLSDGVERVLVPMWLKSDRVADARGNAAASIVWQDLNETGHISPTWLLSDTARQVGADAMLYSSRSCPELWHVVVFRPDRMIAAGQPTDYP